MQKLIRSWRKLYSFAAERVVKRYVQKDRSYNYKGLQLVIYKNVFHPGLFRSTKVFSRWLETKDLAGKSVLELGSGSGLLSLIAARKGASVYAVDINPRAVENAKQNARVNQLNIISLSSDLFSNVPSIQFSIVLVNPPFFPKTPITNYDHAWFCGEHFEYFEKFFQQLKTRPGGEEYYMILSDNCDLQAINNIALSYQYLLNVIYHENVSGEALIIYTIIHAS